jgi:mono/diheme cytochrome c family protein
MKVIGIAVAVLFLLAGGVVGFAYSGIFDVAATATDSPMVRWMLETARESSVQRRAKQVPVPASFTDDRAQRGAKAFDEMCTGCHGAPGRKPFLGAGYMNPSPPDLAKIAPERSPQELFWVIKHGLRMTGMPAWGPTHGDEQLWDLVAMVKRLPTLTPDEYRELTEAPAEDGHHHDHGATLHTTDVPVAEGSGSTEMGEHAHGAPEGHAH